MRYLSTRGGVEPVGFADAVMMGLGTDGGLLVPEQIPKIPAKRLKDWSQLNFQQLAVEVLSPFVGESIPHADLVELVERSYATFLHPEVTPLAEHGGRQWLELFHGPTAAFKDVALQLLGNLFEYLIAREGGVLRILGATSGDTGSAAIYGVRGKAGIDIFILHPKGRVSPIQERQMTTVLDANVHNIAVLGTFDDAQRIVKTLFNDLPFKQQYRLGAVNSINLARILAQTIYYFYAWGRISGGNPEHRVSFSVPTGNFGDVFAGWLAKRMGLPIDRLIIATNRNDILSRFVASGVYQAGEVFQTLSPAMDIQLASNFERYLYYLLDEDPAAVRALLAELEQTGQLQVDGERRRRVAEDFDARAVSDAETLAEIRQVYATSGYILCPHTAVGARAAADNAEAVVLATAHPAKFDAAVVEAIGIEPPPPRSLQGLLERETRCAELAADAEAISGFMRETLGAVED
ncbi:threonine synthase [Lamprobacter modestohalophilus]|uniref:Threonine synthase n=1 Tax=Lamprobacter modestohalophilus TaxID=1064514 RepID=A0A9X0WAR7_9GAMM|nr:threonine synthase [Lamprobacter modestohalophilus]MBK1620046.1 threonine synthase [Lamprobacter modestohalophilus]